MNHTVYLNYVCNHLTEGYVPLLENQEVVWRDKQSVNIQDQALSIFSALEKTATFLKTLPPDKDIAQRAQGVLQLQRFLKLALQFHVSNLSDEAETKWGEFYRAAEIDAYVRERLVEIAATDDTSYAVYDTLAFLRGLRRVYLCRYAAYPLEFALEEGKLACLSIYLGQGALLPMGGAWQPEQLLSLARAKACGSKAEALGYAMGLFNGLQPSIPDRDQRMHVSAFLAARQHSCILAQYINRRRLGLPCSIALSDKGCYAALLWKKKKPLAKGRTRQAFHATWIDSRSHRVRHGVRLVPKTGHEFSESERLLLRLLKGRGILSEGFYVAFDKYDGNGVYINTKEMLLQPRHTTLASVVKTNGPLSVQAQVKLSAHIFDALRQLHDLGYAHGDISQYNILINTETEDAYLIDYGVAYRSDRSPGSPRLQLLQGGGIGTPTEMHELVHCKLGAGAPGDVFEFACILYQLYTGKPVPWWGACRDYIIENKARLESYGQRGVSDQEVIDALKSSTLRTALVEAQKKFIDSWSTASRSYESMLRSALHYDPAQRWTAKQCMQAADEISRRSQSLRALPSTSCMPALSTPTSKY